MKNKGVRPHKTKERIFLHTLYIHLNSHDPYVIEDKQIHEMIYFGKHVRIDMDSYQNVFFVNLYFIPMIFL